MSRRESEPPRLLEEGASPVERALLEAGSSYRGSAALQAKTLAAVGIAGTAVAGEAAAASLSHFGWSKWLASLSVAGATAAVPVAYYVLQDEPAPQVALQSTAAPRANEPPVRFLEPAPLEELAPAPPAPPPAPSAPSPSVESRPALRSSTLAAEVDAVDAARSALARGDARAALSELDAYARVYPRGKLSIEAEVLRIDALHKSGQSQAAKRLAEQFLRQHPKSVLASRVRRFLGN